MDNINEFAVKIGLNSEQTDAVKKYIIDLLLDNLQSMREEYNGEIDRAIKSLTNPEETVDPSRN